MKYYKKTRYESCTGGSVGAGVGMKGGGRLLVLVLLMELASQLHSTWALGCPHPNIPNLERQYIYV